MAVIKDVAKLAGVSVGTISKYLNGSSNLKQGTRMRVEMAIAELQYKPNLLARSMRTGKTHTIAVVVPDIVNPFFAETFNAIRSAAVESGYTPILYTTQDNPDVLKDYLMNLSAREVDGAILCFPDENEAIHAQIAEVQQTLPLVLISWDVKNVNSNCISVDIFRCVEESTRHLIAQQHTRIAYVGGPAINHTSSEKFRGYQKALSDTGISLDPDYCIHGKFNLQTGYMAARTLARLKLPPTAIVAENDILGIGCIKYLLQSGVRIPQEMAVIGCDNISLSAMYEPALSTIALPINRMGTEAMKILKSCMKNPSAKKKLIILEHALVIRQSSDATAGVQFDF